MPPDPQPYKVILFSLLQPWQDIDNSGQKCEDQSQMTNQHYNKRLRVDPHGRWLRHGGVRPRGRLPTSSPLSLSPPASFSPPGKHQNTSHFQVNWLGFETWQFMSTHLFRKIPSTPHPPPPPKHTYTHKPHHLEKNLKKCFPITSLMNNTFAMCLDHLSLPQGQCWAQSQLRGDRSLPCLFSSSSPSSVIIIHPSSSWYLFNKYNINLS